MCVLSGEKPFCLINKKNTNNFKEINCTYETYYNNYKVLFFNKTNEFMFISGYNLFTTIFNNLNDEISACSEQIFGKKSYDYYSIIYNNEYQLVNYTNFQEYNKCKSNATFFENINHFDYIENIKISINKTKNEKELISKLNEIIKNIITINYIDKNEELIIQKDEMTIAFISTHIQKINENNINATTINLKKCEDDLKKAYNISKESNLYILKIDKEQKGKNYPQIEYEVFYPLNNGKMEILNLSFCEDSNIEIYIPIKINGS